VAGDLYEKKFEAESDLALVDSIQIVEGLAPYGKPVWPKLSIVLIISFVLGCLISFIVVSGKSARASRGGAAA
jgi:uncharacterized protein involved in exopolysaccharide biosynthesis